MGNHKEDKWLFPIGITENPIMKTARIVTGKLVLKLNPKLKLSFINGRHPKTKLERCAMVSLVSELHQSGNQAALAQLHRKLWESKDAFRFYESTEGRFETIFLGIKEKLDLILDKITTETAVENVVEIGCGNGKLLAHIAQTRKDIVRHIGLDINEDQINANKVVFQDKPSFEFHACNASEWIAKNPLPKTVYITFGGVLEYFTEKELNQILEMISHNPSIGLIIYEPLAKQTNPSEYQTSVNFGAELSFSHAYSFFIRRAGLKIIFEELQPSDTGQWILLGASN
jgi:SAM-dependent methyltransferase